MKKSNQQIGNEGEKLAVAFLRQRGFDILHQNWRHGHWEVDIIASQKDILHFVEVKTRTSDKYGFPEDSVTTQKMAYLKNAAEQYLELHPEWKKICFDVLAIQVFRGKPPAYFFNEDVYF